MKKIVTFFYFSVFLYACGGGSGEDKITITDNSTNSPGSTIVRSATLPNGTECEAGGIQIESGIDSNTNGKLDTDEVDITKVVCNGTTGYNSLIKIDDEVAGDNCPTGGKSINAGKDLNRNDILDTDEIDDTQYVCNGLAGEKGENGENGENGLNAGVASSCTVANNGDGTSTITCPDGTSSIVSDGATGASSSCSVVDNNDGTKTINCSDGTSATVSNGAAGQDGSSCSVEYITSSLMRLSCDDGTSVLVADGTSNTVIETLFCTGSLENAAGINWTYQAQQFASGDIFVSGSVENGEIAASSSLIYSHQQNGFTTAPVFIAFDLAGTSNGGYWKIFLDRTTLITTIEYNDPDNVTNPRIWDMVSDNCINNEYP